MGPLAARQKPKLWQLNYFTDKAELEALGPRRPGKEEDGAKKKKKGRRGENRERERGHVRLKERKKGGKNQ